MKYMVNPYNLLMIKYVRKWAKIFQVQNIITLAYRFGHSVGAACEILKSFEITMFSVN